MYKSGSDTTDTHIEKAYQNTTFILFTFTLFILNSFILHQHSMRYALPIVVVIACAIFTVSSAQQNVTVNATDSSIQVYKEPSQQQIVGRC
jgi:Ca2+/Na+ antiporter